MFDYISRKYEATMKYYFKRSYAHLQIYGKPFCNKEFSFQEYPYLGREVYKDTGPSNACYRLGEKKTNFNQKVTGIINYSANKI